MKFSQLSVLLALCASIALKGYSADRVATNVLASSAIMAATNPIPNAPAVCPGQGLAQHDFYYAGVAKDERMFIVRRGQIVWYYTHPGRGEISDAVLQPNGNILFAHQFGVTEVTADKKVIWNYDAPPMTEI